jgi:cytochrome c
MTMTAFMTLGCRAAVRRARPAACVFCSRRLGEPRNARHKPPNFHQGRAMSDLKLNSVAGAVLGSVLGVMAIGIFANGLVHPSYPEKAGYLPEVAADATGGPPAPEGPPDFGRLFADQATLATYVTKGERVVGQCQACHDFTAGGPNKIGPNLHDVFGRVPGTHPGFDYSDAMKAHGGHWDYLALNTFLTSPATTVRGTKMGFAGLHNTEDRVAAIAYLRSISPNNVPLPDPLPEAPAAGAAPAGGGAAPAAGGASTATTPASAPATAPVTTPHH